MPHTIELDNETIRLAGELPEGTQTRFWRLISEAQRLVNGGLGYILTEGAPDPEEEATRARLLVKHLLNAYLSEREIDLYGNDKPAHKVRCRRAIALLVASECQARPAALAAACRCDRTTLLYRVREARGMISKDKDFDFEYAYCQALTQAYFGERAQ